MATESDREKAKFDSNQQMMLYNTLNLEFPNNDHQSTIENTIWDEIMKCQDAFQSTSSYFMVLGPAGTGKTMLMRKLHARCRAYGLLIQCCASTTLSALMSDGGRTAHALFKYPVIDDEDLDITEKPECLLENTPRLQMLNDTSVIFWDEFISNNKDLFEAVQRSYKKKIVYVFSGDFAQILPVVKNGSAQDIMNATISTSIYWRKFKLLKLTENMRLQNLNQNFLTATPEQRIHITKQLNYNETLINIAKNTESIHCNVLCKEFNDIHTNILTFPKIDYYLDTEDDTLKAIEWLYPNSEYNFEYAMTRVILCTTNDTVDIWNSTIQSLNPSLLIPLSSSDSFSEVDDPHGILHRSMNEDIMNSVNRTSIPPHILNLKVNDVCIVTRPIYGDNIANNTRVLIKVINKFGIKVLTLNEKKQRLITIPRIHFKFRLNYGNSFEMLRTQFPLRLAYAMTINKSQSQTIDYVLLDCRHQPFSHGHTYVAMSRVRDVNNIKFFITKDQLHEDEFNRPFSPMIPNIVYKSMLF
jgi:hypothetical protein